MYTDAVFYKTESRSIPNIKGPFFPFQPKAGECAPEISRKY